MEALSNIGRALETLSQELEAVPSILYVITAVFFILALAAYGLVIPRLKLNNEQKRRLRKACIMGMLVVYTVLVAAFTIAMREMGEERRINLVFLNSIRDYDHINREIVRDGANLLLFFPIGILSAWWCKPRFAVLKAAACSLGFSLCIEIVQLVGKLGTFDVDDLLFNTLGGLLGAGLVWIWRKVGKGARVLRYSVRVVLVFVLLFFMTGAGAFGTYHILRVSGEESAKRNISTMENRMESRDTGAGIGVTSDPDLILYDGKAYRYNEDLITVLFMGIDQRSEVIEKREGVSGESGQADTIFLLVMNEKTNRMKVIGISRDTMTPIKTFDYKGRYLGESVNHLGLAYAFGDGKHTSCQYMVDAVSNLFYGIPVNSYVALNMESVISINDAVGGVPVTVGEDLTKADKSLYKGAEVTLQGRQALMFMKWRDTTVDHSNNLRMARQKQYIMSFMKQAIQAVRSDMTLPVTLYQELTNEMVTDIGVDQVVYLTTQALSMTLEESDIMMLKGDPARGSVYDEMYVDDDALYDLIIDTFYVEEKLAGEG